MGESFVEPKYRPDDEGYVDWLEVSHGEFNQSMYVGYPYLYGRTSDGHPPLGQGLRIKGDSRDFPHEAQLHIDDIPEFSDRVRCFTSLRDGFERDEEGSLIRLSQEDIDDRLARLVEVGIPEEVVIDAVLQNRSRTLNHQMLNLSWLFQKQY